MNPLFDHVRASLRDLPSEKAEQIRRLLAKRMIIAQYGPEPTLSERYIKDRLNRENND